MKKKLIGLSTLLLVLLLGLSSICYADDQRTWKKEYLQNILYNYFTTYSNYTETQKTNYINNASNWFDSILPIMNENKHIAITFQSSFPGEMYLHYSNGNSSLYEYSNGKLGVLNSNDWKTEKYAWWSSQIVKQNGLGTSYYYEKNYYVMDVNVYTDSTYFLILIPANTIKPNATILTSPYTPATFEFTPNLDYLTAVTIQGNTSTIPTYLFMPSSNYYYTIGTFKDFDLLEGITQTTYYYNTLNRDFEVLNENEVNINSFDVEDNELLFEIDKRTKTADTLTTYNFIPIDPDEWEQQAVTIYWGGVNTKVVNGVVMVDDTFSGDYDNDYTNDLNHEETINAINDIKDTITDDSEVDSIVAENLSGDIDSMNNRIGFTVLDNPFTTFLFYLVDGIYDTLTVRQNINLSETYKSLTFTLQSDDFVSPDGPLKTFIRSFLIFVYLYGNYKYFHYLITLLETANIDRFVSELGTDEFYDTDIM